VSLLTSGFSPILSSACPVGYGIYSYGVYEFCILPIELFRSIGVIVKTLKPHYPCPGNNDLKGRILAMEVSGALVFIGRIKGGIFHKTVV
jgi:hypothetical protein